MKNNEGKVITTLIILIVAVIVIAVVAHRLITRSDGLIRKATSDQEKYDKTEVLEEINFIITQKYLEAYNKSTTDGKSKVEEFFTKEKVIAYLKGQPIKEDGNINLEEVPTETVYIEDLKGEENCYYIKIENFKRDITSYGKGENAEDSKDYFFIKVEGENYNLYYKYSDGEIEEIGALNFEQEI